MCVKVIIINIIVMIIIKMDISRNYFNYAFILITVGLSSVYASFSFIYRMLHDIKERASRKIKNAEFINRYILPLRKRYIFR